MRSIAIELTLMVSSSQAHIIISCPCLCSPVSMSSIDDEKYESVHPSTGAAVGIAVALTLLVSLPVGVVIGVCVSWCVWKSCCAKQQVREQQVREKQLPGASAIYEEPALTGVVETISLSHNQAYGHVNLAFRGGRRAMLRSGENPPNIMRL